MVKSSSANSVIMRPGLNISSRTTNRINCSRISKNRSSYIRAHQWSQGFLDRSDGAVCGRPALSLYTCTCCTVPCRPAVILCHQLSCLTGRRCHPPSPTLETQEHIFEPSASSPTTLIRVRQEAQNVQPSTCLKAVAFGGACFTVYRFCESVILAHCLPEEEGNG